MLGKVRPSIAEKWEQQWRKIVMEPEEESRQKALQANKHAALNSDLMHFETELQEEEK